jgi:hypothetical protein
MRRSTVSPSRITGLAVIDVTCNLSRSFRNLRLLGLEQLKHYVHAAHWSRIHTPSRSMQGICIASRKPVSSDLLRIGAGGSIRHGAKLSRISEQHSRSANNGRVRFTKLIELRYAIMAHDPDPKAQRSMWKLARLGRGFKSGAESQSWSGRWPMRLRQLRTSLGNTSDASIFRRELDRLFDENCGLAHLDRYPGVAHS